MKTICFLLLAVAASTHGQNLLSNPGYETGNFSGWTTSGSALIATFQRGTAKPVVSQP